MKFDIVIGNPPYGVRLEKDIYNFYNCIYDTNNSYALFVELGFKSLKQNGVMSYIVPISFISSDYIHKLHDLLENNCEIIKIISFSDRPIPLFEVCVCTSIFIAKKNLIRNKQIFTTKLHRIDKNNNTDKILNNLEFCDTKKLNLPGRYAKIGNKTEKNIIEKLFCSLYKLRDFIDEQGKPIYYRTIGGRYFNVITTYPNYTSTEKYIKVIPKYVNVIACILSTNLFWFYTQVYGDILSLKVNELLWFPIPDLYNLDFTTNEINSLYNNYLKDIENNAKIKKVSEKSSYKMSKFKEYKIRNSKPLIDKMDDLIGVIYSLNACEINYIKNYEMKYRLPEK